MTEDRTAPLPAENCAEMAEVRREIDRIDRALVRLLAERQTYLDAAGRIKPDKTQVRDAARIEDVVAKVLAEARGAGLSPAIAEPVWRELIERSITHEHGVWDARHGHRTDGE
jgi:isochorismate pyruvate lyase